MKIRIDTLSKVARSERMRRVKAKNTKPEIAVRKLLREVGVKFTSHDRRLPPDFVFQGLKCVVFVHECFWHRHPGLSKLPHATFKVGILGT